jgi:hypothetical protein
MREPRGAGHGQDPLKKTDVARAVAAEGRFLVKVVAETLGVSRSNLHARLNGSAKPRRRYHKAQDGERVNATGSREPANVLPLIRRWWRHAAPTATAGSPHS